MGSWESERSSVEVELKPPSFSFKVVEFNHTVADKGTKFPGGNVAPRNLTIWLTRDEGRKRVEEEAEEEEEEEGEEGAVLIPIGDAAGRKIGVASAFLKQKTTFIAGRVQKSEEWVCPAPGKKRKMIPRTKTPWTRP